MYKVSLQFSGKLTISLFVLLAVFFFSQAAIADFDNIRYTAESNGKKAGNPSPSDGPYFSDTWASLTWSAGDAAASHDVYLGLNFEDVNNGTGNTFQRNQSSTHYIVGFPGFSYPNGLVPGTTYYWRIDEVNDLHPDSPWKGDVWSFTITPSKAHDPEPADGARFIDPNVTLRWQKGFNSKLHMVYFGDNFEEVNNASGAPPQGTTHFFPGFLEVDKTYYWRVDEFDVITTHKGDVWSFTVGAGVPGGAVAGTIYVDAVNGHDNNDGLTLRTAFTTIQKGIDAAEDGEVVLVYPGLYQEEINFMGKSLTVQGVVVSPAGVPVLQNPGDFAVSFYSGEGRESILKNFIITKSFIGVLIAGSSPTISNLTIVNNEHGIETFVGSEPDISNCIFWDNSDDDLFQSQANYSCIERGSEGEGNITDDPLFADPANGDYHLRSERGRYWPEHDIWVLDKVTSPCVDGGDATVDSTNEPVPNGGRINMGAYGGTPEASLSPSGQPGPQPGKASNPNPADGAIDVDRDVTLNWTAGLNAVSHDVYFGSDRNAVANADTSNTTGIYRGRQSATSYTSPGGIGWSFRTYYWRIDEVDSEGNKTTGDVWTFSAIIPPPKGRGCFPADTPVWVDGAMMKISKAVAGQIIGKANCLTTASLEKLEVHQGSFVCRDIVFESGNRISVVDAHCFKLDSGWWIAAQDLRSGLRLKTLNGTVSIKSVGIRSMPFVGKVYNLKIKGADQYFVGKDSVVVRDY